MAPGARRNRLLVSAPVKLTERGEVDVLAARSERNNGVRVEHLKLTHSAALKHEHPIAQACQ
jgi:hypothetical protein